jgi:DNA-directed RNA polymerase subunit alpha
VEAISINNINYEYSSILGIKESVLDILLNLKQVIFNKTYYSYYTTFYFGYIRIYGPKIVKASDIILPNALICIDPTQYIATLSSIGDLQIKLRLASYIFNCSSFLKNSNSYSLLSNYTSYILNKVKFPIQLDSNFSCVNKVNYFLDASDKLEINSNFLTLEVWTNGSISPIGSIQTSLKLIINLFMSTYDFPSFSTLISGNNKLLQTYTYNIANKMLFLKNNFFKTYLKFGDYYNEIKNEFKLNEISIDELNIPLSSKFILKKYQIINLKDLIQFKEKSLKSYFNLSYQSLKVIKQKMLLYNLYLK